MSRATFVGVDVVVPYGYPSTPHWPNTHNMYHPKHTHPNAVFSSVFYVNEPYSSISFIIEKAKIQEGFYFSYEIESYNEFNSAKWEVPIESGDIIFFPGELAHETRVHDQSYERIVIGSSYFANGIYGQSSSYNRINLQNDR